MTPVRACAVMGLVLVVTAGCEQLDGDQQAVQEAADTHTGSGTKSDSAEIRDGTVPTPPCQGIHCSHSGPASSGVVAAEGKLISAPSGERENAGGIGTIQQALSTTEGTILATSGTQMAETAVGVLKGSDGVWQTVVASNLMSDTGSKPDRWDYGCIRGSSTVCDFNITWSDVGADPSIIAGGQYLYSSRLRSSPNEGLRMARSNNPCPNGCSFQSWQTCTIDIPADFPMAVDASDTQIWFAYNDFSEAANIGAAVAMVRVDWCTGSTRWKFNQQCSNMDGTSIRNPHGVLGGANKIHVVYVDLEDKGIWHTTFNKWTNTWNCSPTRIAAFEEPPGTCSGQTSKRVMPNLGNDNLEFNQAPRIARDWTSRWMVVTFDSYDSSGKVRSKAYLSKDEGNSWTRTLLTAGETGHSAVAAGCERGANCGGPAYRFEISNSYNSAGNDAREVRWKSTDAGQSWTGLYISSAREVAPVLSSSSQRPCFWGDYEGVAWHKDNDAFYHSWVDTNQGANSVIRGRFRDKD